MSSEPTTTSGSESVKTNSDYESDIESCRIYDSSDSEYDVDEEERRRAAKLSRYMDRIYQLDRQLKDLKTDAQNMMESRDDCENCRQFLVPDDEEDYLYALYKNHEYIGCPNSLKMPTC
jgi:hypothetical protein